MQLPLNAMVFFIEDAGDFLKVSYSGTMGYVKREYLRGRGEADSVPMYIANCEEWVSLWEEESTKSERLEKIPLDAPVVAHGRLGDEESSFTLVSYNYRLGYVLNEYLSLLPPKQNQCAIVSADLHVPDKNGDIFTQTITNETYLETIETMFRAATPFYSGKFPYQAQLILTLRNGNSLTMMYPTDGCSSFFLMDGSVYAIPESMGDTFWGIFAEAASELGFP